MAARPAILPAASARPARAITVRVWSIVVMTAARSAVSAGSPSALAVGTNGIALSDAPRQAGSWKSSDAASAAAIISAA